MYPSEALLILEMGFLWMDFLGMLGKLRDSVTVLLIIGFYSK
jgi:hypothetical protein